jgi:hypothetical protein
MNKYRIQTSIQLGTGILKSSILALAFLIACVSSVSAQEINDKFFDQVHSFLDKHVADNAVDYAAVRTDAMLSTLVNKINNADISNSDDDTKQAFYINAYNLLVINQVIQEYPIASVQEKSGFFTKSKFQVAGESLTLNQIEHEKLLGHYMDGRYHFVLVCGAVGCPPITNFAYRPESLDAQLDGQVSAALNNPSFTMVNGQKLELSQIFNWYKADFGKSKMNVIDYINQYRDDKIDPNCKLGYYPYDWQLNDKGTSLGSPSAGGGGANAYRYVVSSAIPVGTYEFKIFNNLYSQQTGQDGNLTDRASFFTTTLSALYGFKPKLNVGINARWRKVRNHFGTESTPFDVFGSDVPGLSRKGLTAIGPQIRYAPVEAWSNFSIQSSFVFSIGEDLTGNDTETFIDWDGPTWNTQFFNDFSIGEHFSLFTELDFLIEGIGEASQFSTPFITIFSYIPTTKLVIYTIGGYSPIWVEGYDYFYQFGAGAKYQFTPSVELEVLYTDFTNKGLRNSGGQAETINLGFRLNI